MGLLGGHGFYIKNMNVLCKRWECKVCKHIFTRDENLIKHLKEERCAGGKTKMICSWGKFRHILNSSEKVFYGGDTKFSYTACQWIETETIKIGKQIYDKMYGHGGERMVRVWVLMIKAKKYLHCSWLVVINLRPTQYTSFTDTISMDIRVRRTVPKDMIYIDTCKIDWLIANNG